MAIDLFNKCSIPRTRIEHLQTRIKQTWLKMKNASHQYHVIRHSLHISVRVLASSTKQSVMGSKKRTNWVRSKLKHFTKDCSEQTEEKSYRSSAALSPRDSSRGFWNASNHSNINRCKKVGIRRLEVGHNQNRKLINWCGEEFVWFCGFFSSSVRQWYRLEDCFCVTQYWNTVELQISFRVLYETTFFMTSVIQWYILPFTDINQTYWKKNL